MPASRYGCVSPGLCIASRAAASPDVFPNSTLLPHTAASVRITAAAPTQLGPAECRFALLDPAQQTAPAFAKMAAMAARLNATAFAQDVAVGAGRLTVVAVRCNTTEPGAGRDRTAASGAGSAGTVAHASSRRGLDDDHAEPLVTARRSAGAGADLGLGSISEPRHAVSGRNAGATLRGFRAVGALKPTFPRRGNLWGSSNFEGKGTAYAASHVDLWLGSSWSAEDTAQLRKHNNATLALTSTNAVEMPDGLPEVGALVVVAARPGWLSSNSRHSHAPALVVRCPFLFPATSTTTFTTSAGRPKPTGSRAGPAPIAWT